MPYFHKVIMEKPKQDSRETPCNHVPTIKTWMSCYFCVVRDEAETCESCVFSHRESCGSVQGEGDVAAV